MTDLASRIPELAGDDLMFFGYESVNTRVRFSALALYRFLDELFTQPTPLFTAGTAPQGPSRSGIRYTRVMIVAHSLGALVARTALVEAWYARSKWRTQVDLVLFAPADTGADVVALANSVPGAGRLVRMAAVARFRALLDLEPNSQALRSLAEGARAAIAAGEGAVVRARMVILGDRDTIVSPNRFLDDPPARVLAGGSHTSVCKPRRSFLAPLEAVVEAWSAAAEVSV